MNIKYACACLLSLMVAAGTISAQEFYQSAQNKYYWKNRKPNSDYWQQDVHYYIKANIDEQTDIIDGQEKLQYWNNSPDQLTFVYFHLYSNAFTPGSYMDNLQKANNVNPKYGKYEGKGLGCQVESITLDGKTLKTELDNTILKVYLDKPLASGQSVTFEMKFKSYFDKGTTRRRMKMFDVSGYKHYDGVHWYPRISVYDRKFGWTTDQHMGKEFYGDFGSYDVELTFANNYVMDATGILTNRAEVLPDSLRKKLDIKNFANKPLNEKPGEVIKPNGTRKTWKFHADNVHDFAFTADPTYRIGEAEWNGVKCIALAEESHASRWQNAADYTAKIIKLYSEDIGMYAYPKMIVADAQDGMEYPMLTLDGGLDPDYRGLLCHEIGHNWFFGMVGNNETYRAALDEGFTQFLTTWSLEKLEGPIDKPKLEKSKYVDEFYKPATVRWRNAYSGYMADAIRDNDMPLNTHSDDFNGALEHGGGYRHVYFKTATMLYNLQYVLGDTIFQKAMQYYFSKWMLCHPYFDDFRSSIIEYTKVDLNWFFDEWMETTKHIDYAVTGIDRGGKADEYVVTFKRKGDMQMPLDFRVTANDEKYYDFHIPNDWYVKPTSATVLPRWIGWGPKLNTTYKAKITIPGGIDNIEIDTTHRLADINMLNNSYKFPISVSFDSKVQSPVDWTKYEIKVAPDIWYNNYDGLKAGFHVNSGYMNYQHIIDGSFWLNTGMGQQTPLPVTNSQNGHDAVSFNLKYRTGLDKLSKNLAFTFSAKSLDGLMGGTMGLEQSDKSLMNTLYLRAKSMYRRNEDALNYLLYPALWNADKFNNTITIGLVHRYQYYTGSGNIDMALRSSSLGSDYNYNNLTITAINTTSLGKKLVLKTRVFGQYSKNSISNIAPESGLYLAGANPEALMENKYTRSRGIIDNTWVGDYGNTTNHFQMGGGLNLRGYAGYLVAQTDKAGNLSFLYTGNSGASFTGELEFDKFAKLQPKLFRNWLKINTYLFTDAGAITYNSTPTIQVFGDIRADAGIGTALTIKKWGPLQTANPLTIRFDMPLWLNRPPAEDPQYFKFRWLVGINRTF